MKLLLGHGFAHEGAFGKQWIEDWLGRLRSASIDIYPIQIGLDVPGRRLPWKELDRRWRRGDRELLTLYEEVARGLEGYDVLINYGGLNLHPEFLRQLPTINVLVFYDDPESSEDYSRPVAQAHDFCIIGNTAEIKNYESWGVKNIHWAPQGFRADEYDPALTYEDILTKPRDIDVTLLCERLTHWRRKKVDQFSLAFPQGVYRGPGWPQGFLLESERVPILQRTKIGINIHNTTGPTNFRTYYLPANGILQICDQKSELGKYFELGKEVIGYDTIDEAIDLCRYYLAHEDERREIAAAGWQRVIKDYNEVAAFKFITRAIDEVVPEKKRQSHPYEIVTTLHRHRQGTRARRLTHIIGMPIYWPYHQGPRYIRGAYRRMLRLVDNINLRFRAKKSNFGPVG